MSANYAKTCDSTEKRKSCNAGHWVMCETCAALVCFKHAVKRYDEGLRCAECGPHFIAFEPTSVIRFYTCAVCKSFKGMTLSDPGRVPDCAFCHRPMTLVRSDRADHIAARSVIGLGPNVTIDELARELIRKNDGMMWGEALTIADYLIKARKAKPYPTTDDGTNAPKIPVSGAGSFSKPTCRWESRGAYPDGPYWYCATHECRHGSCAINPDIDRCANSRKRDVRDEPKPTISADKLFRECLESAAKIADHITETELIRSSESWRSLASFMDRARAGEMQSGSSSPHRDDTNGKTYLYITCHCGNPVKVTASDTDGVTCSRCQSKVYPIVRYPSGAHNAPCS